MQHYAWGGSAFIPAWLGIENNSHKPFAEYWMGAHPSASSDIIYNNDEYDLNKLIKEDSLHFLSKETLDQFDGLPYLFKILDVHDMLSIQVHPSKTEAEKGFANEENSGVHIHAPHRNYKDKNHKPEMMVALSEFWLLHGFKQKEELKEVLYEVKEFESLIKFFSGGNYKALYKHVMTLPQKDVDILLRPLIEREILLNQQAQLNKSQPGWWVAKLFEHHQPINNFDRGIFSIYFFNIVELNPGEAIFQDAGVPHAYLEGQNMELMASSDNVLRGGLTSKHIDVKELMKHVLFEGIQPTIIKGIQKSSNEKIYPSAAIDFGISNIELKSGRYL